MGRRQLRPGGVARHAARPGMAHQILLAIGPGRSLQRLDRSAAQCLALIRDDQAPIHPDHPAKTTAGLTGAEGRVEAEQRRLGLGVADAAFGAMQAGGELPQQRVTLLAKDKDIESAGTPPQSQLDGLHHPHRLGVAHAKTVGHHVDDLARPLHPLGLHPGEAAGRQPLLLLLRRGVCGQSHRKGEDQTRITRVARPPGNLLEQRLRRVVPDRQAALAVKQVPRAGEQEF